MVRVLWILAAMACTPERVCDEAACEDVCGVPVVVTERGEGSTVLTEYERLRLASQLKEIEGGVQPIEGDDGRPLVGVCRGATRCEEAISLVSGPLPPGDYLIGGVFDVPEVGRWTASATLACRLEAGGVEAPEPRRREVVLEASEGGTDFVAFPLPNPTRPGQLWICDWSLAVPTGDGSPMEWASTVRLRGGG